MPYFAIACATSAGFTAPSSAKRLQRGHGHEAPVDLEEVAQLLARVRAAETVGAEHV